MDGYAQELERQVKALRLQVTAPDLSADVVRSLKSGPSNPGLYWPRP
jgi:hypothetical protein